MTPRSHRLVDSRNHVLLIPLAPTPPASSVPEQQDLSALLDIVEERFSSPEPNRRSSMMQSKSELRIELARSKEQLIIESIEDSGL